MLLKTLEILGDNKKLEQNVLKILEKELVTLLKNEIHYRYFSVNFSVP